MSHSYNLISMYEQASSNRIMKNAGTLDKFINDPASLGGNLNAASCSSRPNAINFTVTIKDGTAFVQINKLGSTELVDTTSCNFK